MNPEDFFFVLREIPASEDEPPRYLVEWTPDGVAIYTTDLDEAKRYGVGIEGRDRARSARSSGQVVEGLNKSLLWSRKEKRN